MSASATLVQTSKSDELFLIDLYASTRAAELSVVPWNDEQKRAFLKMQFEAQDSYYRERYPNASFDIIKLNERAVGRFYRAELSDEIRIIDLVFLPEHFDSDIFIRLIKETLHKGEQDGKPVRIFLESFDPKIEIFKNLGFEKIEEHGIYLLWQFEPASLKAKRTRQF